MASSRRGAQISGVRGQTERPWFPRIKAALEGLQAPTPRARRWGAMGCPGRASWIYGPLHEGFWNASSTTRAESRWQAVRMGKWLWPTCLPSLWRSASEPHSPPRGRPSLPGPMGAVALLQGQRPQQTQLPLRVGKCLPSPVLLPGMGKWGCAGPDPSPQGGPLPSCTRGETACWGAGGPQPGGRQVV